MNGRRTVLFLHPSDELYGSDQMLLHGIRGLDKDLYQALVVLPRDLAYPGLLSEQLRIAGAQVHFMDLGVIRRRYLTVFRIPGLGWRLMMSTIRLRRLIRQGHVDLVYTNTLVIWSGALAARWTRRPHLWHVHELVTGWWWLRRLVGRVVRALAGTLVVNSVASAEALLGPNRSRHVEILPNGVEMPRRYRADARERIRKDWQVGDEHVVVGSIGRLSYRKGQRQLIAAAAVVLKKTDSIRLVVVGGTVPGQERFLSELQADAAQLGIENRVIFTGFRQDIDDILEAVDLFVMPSLLPEPFGLAAVEAMAHARAVIGTRAGGLAEVVADQQTGLLVPPGDPSALATAILSLAEDRLSREFMGVEGRRRVMNSFTLEAYAVRYRQILATIFA